MALPVSAPDLAIDRAERIRSSLEERGIPAAGTEIRVTVSIGLAVGQLGRPNSELALIEAADRALYQAKSDGRNRVVLGRSPCKPEARETESAEFLTSLQM